MPKTLVVWNFNKEFMIFWGSWNSLKGIVRCLKSASKEATVPEELRAEELDATKFCCRYVETNRGGEIYSRTFSEAYCVTAFFRGALYL